MCMSCASGTESGGRAFNNDECRCGGSHSLWMRAAPATGTIERPAATDLSVQMRRSVSSSHMARGA